MTPDAKENMIKVFSDSMACDIKKLAAFKDHKNQNDRSIADEALKWFDEEELPKIKELCSLLAASIEAYENMEVSADDRRLHGKILNIVKLNKDSVSTRTLAEGVGQAIAQHLFE